MGFGKTTTVFNFLMRCGCDLGIILALWFLCGCSEEFRKGLEVMRSRVLSRAAVKIQAVARMFLARKHWPQLKFSLQQAQLQGAAQQSLLK